MHDLGAMQMTVLNCIISDLGTQSIQAVKEKATSNKTPLHITENYGIFTNTIDYSIVLSSSSMIVIVQIRS